MKGEELARAVRSLDRDWEREEVAEAEAEASARGSFSHRQHNLSASQSPYDSPVPQAYMPLTLSHPQAQYPSASSSLLGHRRSSSVPLPNDWYPAAFGANPFLPRASFSSMGLGFPSSSSSSSPFVPSSLNPNASSNTIALPSVPYISHSATHSRAPSPVHGISHAQRRMLGHRRASSAQPVGFNMFAGRRSWTMPAYGSSAFNGYAGTGMNGVGMNGMSMNPFFGYDAYDASMGYDASLGMGGMSAPLERDDEPLPKVDGSLFTTDFSFSSNPAADFTSAQAGSPPHDPSTTPPSIAPHALPALDLDSARLGWDEASLASAASSCSTSAASSCSTSGASTATSASVSGSPAPSDSEALLPEIDAMGMGMGVGVHTHAYYAPMHAIGPYDMGFDGAHTHAYDMGMGLDAEMGMGLEQQQHHQHHQHGHHLSAEMGVDAMIHAPGVGGKHAMSMGLSPQQEATPTATVFGGEVHHNQQEFESVFEDYGM